MVRLLFYYQPKFEEYCGLVEREETKLNWGYTHASMINNYRN